MLVDTHLHLLKSDFDDIDKVISDAKKVGVNYLILGGCDKESNYENVILSNKYDNVYSTLGFHPEFCNVVTDDDLEKLEIDILNNDKVVAIGEIGLDYHYGKEDKDKQIWLFEKQLMIAERLGKAVVIHTRDAINDTYEILKKYNVKGVIHCFSGSLEMANKFIDLGFCLGIGGVLMFHNSNLKDVVREISLSWVVFETDSPYLSPIRGEVNEPCNVRLIANYLSDLKGIPINEVENVTTDNVRRIFDIKL